MEASSPKEVLALMDAPAVDNAGLRREVSVDAVEDAFELSDSDDVEDT